MSQVGEQLFRLSDPQLAAVVQACRPLRPLERRAFLEELAERLRGSGAIGDGSLHRTIAELQRRFFSPPLLDGSDAA